LLFFKCSNPTRPMRRLLLSGLPLVLTTRYFGMRSDLTLSASLPPVYCRCGSHLGLTGSEKFCRYTDLSPACRAQSRARRYNRCWVNRDLLRDRPCREPECRNSNRFPSSLPRVLCFACLFCSAVYCSCCL